MFFSKKQKEKKIINEIQNYYWRLNEIVIPIYNFSPCTKCNGYLMNIHVISPSGNSIEYSCENCGEIMTCTLLKGKNPKKAISIQNQIIAKMRVLRALIGDEIHNRNIDIYFDIRQ